VTATRGFVRHLRTAVPFALVALVAACSPSGQSKTAGTPPDNAAAPAEDALARGRRITYTSACMDCHTPGSFYGAPDTTRLLSGSELGWTTPLGTAYAANLTPDSSTGIGTWTEDQIVTAVREGHRPDGTPLLPPMPWPVYSHMTDADVHALAHYLKSIPAVHHDVPKDLKPGEKAPTAVVFPPPPAYDAKKLPPPPAPAAH